jgi:hypothetical protein
MEGENYFVWDMDDGFMDQKDNAFEVQCKAPISLVNATSLPYSSTSATDMKLFVSTGHNLGL